MMSIGVLALVAIGAVAPPPIAVSMSSASPRPGDIVLVSIAVAEPSDGMQVRAFGHDSTAYRVGDRAWQAIVGIDLDVKPGSYPVVIVAGNGSHRIVVNRRLVVAPRIFRTRRLTVNPAFVTPPLDEQARIAADARLLGNVWASAAPERLWSAAFVRPVPGIANSAFGTRSVFNGQPRSPHGGADLLSPAGTAVHAPNTGRVVVARDLYFSGNTVVIDHGLGLFSLLAHLSTLEVAEGDVVVVNQIVGRVGATGRVTGPHLHWAVRAGGARVDPIALLEVLGGAGLP
jgi:murein DD-endopeptidase MepM/ murein hydrolase activator NlpD